MAEKKSGRTNTEGEKVYMYVAKGFVAARAYVREIFAAVFSITDVPMAVRTSFSLAYRRKFPHSETRYGERTGFGDRPGNGKVKKERERTSPGR